MTDKCNTFNDALDNEDYRGILLKCLKIFEKEVKTIGSLVAQNRQTQIKKVNSHLLIFQNQSNLSPISLKNMKKNVRKNIKL